MALLTSTTKVARLAGLACITFALCIAPSRKGVAQDAETGVKAAFLYNFTKFVEWPAAAFTAPDAPIVVCTLGGGGLEDAVRTVVARRTSQNRAVDVRDVAKGDARTCHMLFVSDDAPDHGAALLAQLRDAPVLTVGETAGFASGKGIIGFTRDGDRIRFEIDENAARSAGLKISAKLLSLSKGGGGS